VSTGSGGLEVDTCSGSSRSEERMLYSCFTHALLIFYSCFTYALLMLYLCFTYALSRVSGCSTAAHALLFFTHALLMLYSCIRSEERVLDGSSLHELLAANGMSHVWQVH
jgi:hypothetical protein